MRPTRSVRLVAAAGAALLLAGCSGSNGISAAIGSASRAAAGSTSPTSAPQLPGTATAGPGPGTTPSGSPSNPSVPPSNPSVPPSNPSATPLTGGAGLAAIVVRLSDLPTGWTATPYRPDPDDQANQAALLTCVGVQDTNGDKTGQEHSPDFTYGNASVLSQAERFRSDHDLAIDQSLLHNPKTAGCYRKLLTPASLGAPSGSKLTSAVFDLSGRTSGQPSNVVGSLRAVITVAVPGQKVVLYADSVYIRGPRIEAEIDFTNIGARVPAAFRATLTAEVAARAARA